MNDCHKGGRDLGTTGGCLCTMSCCNSDSYCICPDEIQEACLCDHEETEVTDPNPGDQVTASEYGSPMYGGGPEREIVHATGSWVIYKLKGREYSMLRERFEQNFEKVVPFFEVGKTYRYSTLRFRVEHVTKDTKGKVAFGVDTSRLGSEYAAMRRELLGWEECT